MKRQYALLLLFAVIFKPAHSRAELSVLDAFPSAVSVSEGGSFNMTFRWDGGPALNSYKVFVHFDGVGHDFWPKTASNLWRGRYEETVPITPEKIPPGSYAICIGLYDPMKGSRVRMNMASQALPCPKDSWASYQVATIKIIPAAAGGQASLPTANEATRSGPTSPSPAPTQPPTPAMPPQRQRSSSGIPFFPLIIGVAAGLGMIFRMIKKKGANELEIGGKTMGDTAAVATHKRVSGLSGNEIFCLSQMGMRPGQLCVGNSVVSIGFSGGIGAGLSTLGGGEVPQITQLVHDGRMKAYSRMMEEAQRYGGLGLTGVSFDMVNHGGNLEFITIGSTARQSQGQDALRFSTSADAQQLYCQVDAGFNPLHFVFGNVAYSIGVGGNLSGAFKKLSRGEVPQYSEIFDTTRHLALSRIVAEAKRHGANAVIGIETTIAPLLGAQEMMMVGTASQHPLLAAYASEPVTSDMTNEEMWNMASLGYLPLRLVMGVSVYSLGLKGGIVSSLQSFGGGEISGLTEILYEAREKALARIERDAETCGADEVVGVKTRVYDLGGGLVEFMAIGTAVKKFEGAKTRSPSLIPQAIIQDKDTFVDSTSFVNIGAGDSKVSARRAQGGPVAIIGVVFMVMFYLLNIVLRVRLHH